MRSGKGHWEVQSWHSPGSKGSFLVCVAMPGSHLGLVLPCRSRTLLQVPTLHSSSGSAGLLLNTDAIAVLAAPRVKRRRFCSLGSIGHAWGHEFESQYPCKRLDTVLLACNPKGDEEGTGGPLGLAGQQPRKDTPTNHTATHKPHTYTYTQTTHTCKP